ncbi:MAG: M48 family metalloprotease [Burkholderiaceae bacterium]
MSNRQPSDLSPAAPGFADRLARARLSRRDLLWLVGVTSGSAAIASLQGCAKSPVTGETILVGMSEEQERRVDQEVAPHQFSQDFGAVQADSVNRYVSEVGARMSANTHRPNMPYNYRVLNANYVNAYTFPGGAMGVTRGIMLDLKDEAQLSALLGHEMGHVNARHAAQRQGAAMVAQVAVVGVNVAARESQWGQLVGIASQVGASALLSSYSRDNEREADALGQEYMVRSGYPATGMTGLHQLLLSKHSSEPNLLQTMFSTHPMPAERAETARRLAETRYKASVSRPANRERFMDNTAPVRALAPTIRACQEGESAAANKALPEAEQHFATALKHQREDYAANVLMSKVLLAQNRHGDAQRFADVASRVYPQEAQAQKLAGVTRLARKDYAGAYARLNSFDRLLPGDPGVLFLKGVALEGSGDRNGAAQHYYDYASKVGGNGNASQYAISRLRAWGKIR